MQRGSLALVSRKEGPDVWQFRWSEKDLHGVRVQRKRVIGTVERYPDGAAARTAMTIVLAELNSGKARISCSSITVAQLCDHFEQRELTRDNTWRRYSTKKTYQAYLNRWILPHRRRYELAEVRTINAAPSLKSQFGCSDLLPLRRRQLRKCGGCGRCFAGKRRRDFCVGCQLRFWRRWGLFCCGRKPQRQSWCSCDEQLREHERLQSGNCGSSPRKRHVTKSRGLFDGWTRSRIYCRGRFQW